jgi:hypothetical protein
MKLVPATVAVLAGLAILGGTTSAALAAPKPKAPRLASLLLTAGEMPRGWSLVPTVPGGVGCLQAIFEPAGVRQTARAQVTFIDNAGPPQVEEDLATYAGPATVAFGKIVALLATCKHISGISEGTAVSGTLSRLSIPLLGAEDAGFRAKLRIKTTAAGQDLLIVRQGNIVMGISEGVIGTPDVRQLDRFARIALAKLPG